MDRTSERCCSISKGCSGSATGLPASEASYGPGVPFSSRGLAFQVVGTTALVVGDNAVADHDPGRQRPARRVVEADAADLTLGEFRLDVDGVVAAPDIFHQALPVLDRQIGKHGTAD